MVGPATRPVRAIKRLDAPVFEPAEQVTHSSHATSDPLTGQHRIGNRGQAPHATGCWTGRRCRSTGCLGQECFEPDCPMDLIDRSAVASGDFYDPSAKTICSDICLIVWEAHAAANVGRIIVHAR